MAKRYAVRSTRASRRVFAQKSQPTMMNLRKIFTMRGGGYL